MDGKSLYSLFDAAPGPVLAPWEHLTNEQRSRWDATANTVDEDIDDQILTLELEIDELNGKIDDMVAEAEGVEA